MVSCNSWQQDDDSPVSSQVPTSNKYEALAVDEIKEQESQGETASAMHAKSNRRKWRVLVGGDSLLRGTEVPIC